MVYAQENEIGKILWDFEIQMDNLISARQPDLVIVKKIKRTCWIMVFAIMADQGKTEGMRKDR